MAHVGGYQVTSPHPLQLVPERMAKHMRSELLVPGRIQGNAQGVDERADTFSSQAPPVIARTVTEEHCILFVGRSGLHRGTKAGNIEPDRLLDWLIQDDGQSLPMMSLGDEMNEVS